ncbi:MAG: hypothetical protein IPH75_12215 [bacterium]|nr:hypothetical protein [bacterium]
MKDFIVKTLLMSVCFAVALLIGTLVGRATEYPVLGWFVVGLIQGLCGHTIFAPETHRQPWRFATASLLSAVAMALFSVAWKSLTDGTLMAGM